MGHSTWPIAQEAAHCASFILNHRCQGSPAIGESSRTSIDAVGKESQTGRKPYRNEWQSQDARNHGFRGRSVATCSKHPAIAAFACAITSPRCSRRIIRRNPESSRFCRRHWTRNRDPVNERVSKKARPWDQRIGNGQHRDSGALEPSGSRWPSRVAERDLTCERRQLWSVPRDSIGAASPMATSPRRGETAIREDCFCAARIGYTAKSVGVGPL